MRPPRPPDPAGRLRAWLEVPLSYQPSVAADGETILHLGTAGGLPQVWEVSRDGGASRRRYAPTERVGELLAAPMGEHALVAVDRGGDEHWQLALLRAPESPKDEPRALTNAPTVIHMPGRWRPDGQSFLYTSNARDERFFDVYEQGIAPGATARRLIEEDATLAVRDVRGDEALVQRANTNLDGDLLLHRRERTVHLTPHDGELSILDGAILADGVYAAANPGRELAALVRYRAGTGQHEFVQTFPGELEMIEPSPAGDLLALVVNRDGWSETHLFDPATREDRLMNSGPRGVVGRISWFPDGSAFAYDLSSVEGIELFRRTVGTGKERRLTGAPGAVPSVVAPPKLGRIRASDGVEIPYWEYSPTDPATRETIVFAHGGPEAQARPSFSPFLFFLVSEGYRVVVPNVRGSTGYGRTFTHLDDRRLRMDSVRDLAEVAEALVRTGRGRAGRLGVIGGSYGGFLVLAVTANYPELWGAAVDLVGISNFVTFLERTGPWRRRLREAEYGSLETDREFLTEISPIHQAASITAPLLVIHGRNDPRVPVAEAEQIVGTLRALGRSVDLLVFDDEGHGIFRRENQVTAWTRAAAFFAEHLDSPRPPR